MKKMIKCLNENEYELVIKTKDYMIYDNKKIEQVVVLMPKFEYGSESEKTYLDYLIEKLDEFRYKKRTMAFIGEIKEEDREEVLSDKSHFMKIEGFKSELIPRRVNKTVEFVPVEYQLENGLFFNPYHEITSNIINLLKEINTGTSATIIYNYPKPMYMEMLYFKYLLLNKVNLKEGDKTQYLKQEF